MGEGTTDSEKYLSRLCKRSFLSLWSYSNPYRDQHAGKHNTSQGKEICDQLVVFGDELILFSDKYCHFEHSRNLQLDWSRWFRKAVWDSAKQLKGGVRWIMTFPNRVFLDKECRELLPISVAITDKTKIHRVVVAHGASDRCKSELGGNGSLMVMPEIEGEQHFQPVESSVPFAVGKVLKDGEFVHVFDDYTLDVVVRHLDTITDFVQYLTDKEQFMASGRFFSAAGEEEILAYYLRSDEGAGKHGFSFGDQYSGVALIEGLWQEFLESPQWKAARLANEASYGWDRLIEKFTKHVIEGTNVVHEYDSIDEIERVIRFMASEPRVRRRFIMNSLYEVMRRAMTEMRSLRILEPSSQGDPYYALLSLQRLPDASMEDYREVRLGLLRAYCMVLKLRFPEAKDIVGIAVDAANTAEYGSEDLMYIDGREWTAAAEEEAKKLQKEFNLLTQTRRLSSTVYEYPVAGTSRTRKGRDRNKLCPCGSGKKYKNCCGRQV